MTFVDLVMFRRVSTAVMVLLMTAFLVSAVAGALRNAHPTGLTQSLAGVAILLGLVFATMRTMRFAAAKGIDTRGPLPVFLFVLFFGFIGGIGLQQTVLALQPTVSVTAEVIGCGSSGRTVKCAGEYTVDGVEFASEMPVRSVPSDRKVVIEVLASDHSVVVSKSLMDVLFFRGGGIVLAVLAVGYGVRWNRVARAATAELRNRFPAEVHSNGSNPPVN
ncbi:hypothetical protein [Lentzea sp. NPDC051838]|uniref:hypothetical protein n=1 Tax=Lentzea sp. NPDC051838 TaxID=3154849 RepID=UPI003436E17F